MMLLEFMLLVAFTFVLSKMSCIAVEQAGKLSDYFGLSRMAIGILVVGTMVALPELSVAITSSAVGQGEISAGNVFGANVVLILFAFGIGAIVYGFRIERKNLEDVGFVLLLTFLISIYMIFMTQIAGRTIGFLEGVALYVIFAWYAAKMVIDKAISTRKPGEDQAHFNTGTPDFLRLQKIDVSGPVIALIFFASVLSVYVSAGIVVNAAISIATELGLAQSFIGATLIALGTSLPEIMVGFEALKKKMYGLALGDIMGSIMANITLVLGTAAIIQPISLHLKVFGIAMLFAVLANVLFFYYAAMKGRMGKSEGIALVGFFVLYVIVISASQVGLV
ncbi:MAG: sodium:calcium antiporter [Candidatus Micrarchaeia archaeon]